MKNGFSPFVQKALWLLTIVAPAAWVVPLGLARLAAGPPDFNVELSEPSLAALLGLPALGLLPALICLVTVWAVLLHQRLPASLARGAAQLGAMYLSIMALLQTDPPIWQTPWAMALGMASFIVPPLVVSFVLRLFRWRLVRPPRGEEALPLPAPRYQFRLADVFVWMTLIAVFLALGTVLLSRFRREPEGWEGLGLAILVMICLTLCAPTGILSVVFTWLVLVERRGRARAIVAVGLQLIWVGSIFYVLASLGSRPFRFDLGQDAFAMLAIPPALALPALVLLGLARLVGWRMVRLPKAAQHK